MPEEVAAHADTRPETIGLGLEDALDFRCDHTCDCFTNCCRDVSIVLTPYDVLRMKHALGVDSTTFLQNHTIISCTRNRKLPVVLLRMNAADKRCPFVTQEGCSVYAHRPWACRMYPLGLAEPKNPTPAERGFYFVIHEDFCHGKGTHSIREWISKQDIESFEMMGASFQRLMLDDFWLKEEPLPIEAVEMYLMACFDLDRFRRFVFETRFLQLFEVHEERVEALRTDDEELLEFAMEWLRFSLFHEKSMRLKKDADTVRRRNSTPVEDGTAVAI